jgi:hypothetical protein
MAAKRGDERPDARPGATIVRLVGGAVIVEVAVA